MELRDEIAKAAYSLFEKSGWVHGKHEEHWFEAEKAVSSRMGGEATQKIKAAIGSKDLVLSKPQKKGIWPQDKPAAESKKTTRARRNKARSAAKP